MQFDGTAVHRNDYEGVLQNASLQAEFGHAGSCWLGVAMRTDAWRYVEWTRPGEQPVRELYDMARDPQNDLNIADKPEHATLRESLSKRLREQFPVQEFKPPAARKQSAVK